MYNTIKYNIIIIIIIILTSVDMYMINHKIITNPFIQIEEVLLQKMIKLTLTYQNNLANIL